MKKLLPIVSIVLLASCTDNADSPTLTSAGIEISLPEGIEATDLREACASFYNISSGEKTDISMINPVNVSASVTPGFYNLTYSATVTLDNGVDAQVRGQLMGVTVSPEGTNLCVPTFASIATDDLIISELFFTGTLQTSGNQYNGDQYIKLYNNTDHVIYADGLTIFESLFLTTQKFNYTPDIMATDVTVDALYTIPGSGKDYPVAPGEELLIADIAIDHRAINSNSFDLSHADFEWYDQSSTPAFTDIDNPDVPNLDKWYSYTLSVWQLHNRGLKAYGIARIGVDKEEYLENYRYITEYDQTTVAGTFPMSKTAYRLPNEWVVDIVNCSVGASYIWNVCDPSLDMGWTYCSEVDEDKKRYFRAVRRKAYDISAEGIAMLYDTNNSTHDFNAYTIPSEIERQHSVCDADGSVAQFETYDGVMKK